MYAFKSASLVILSTADARSRRQRSPQGNACARASQALASSSSLLIASSIYTSPWPLFREEDKTMTTACLTQHASSGPLNGPHSVPHHVTNAELQTSQCRRWRRRFLKEQRLRWAKRGASMIFLLFSLIHCSIMVALNLTLGHSSPAQHISPSIMRDPNPCV